MKEVKRDAPLVSVGIPLYRSARFLDVIIANIEAMPQQDIEILISDRHCYDDAIESLQALYRSDSRIRFFKAQDELDWVGNINFLLSEARGKYWRLLPHDDSSPKGSLEELIYALDMNEDAILAYGPTHAINIQGQHLPKLDKLNPQPVNLGNQWELGTALKMCWSFEDFAGSFKGVVRRKVIAENHLFIRSTSGQVIPERGWQFALCLLGRFIFVPGAIYIKKHYPESTHAQWKIAGNNYYSLARAASKYLWNLVSPLSARLYGIVDIWLNAHRLARWQDSPNRGKRPAYLSAPDPLNSRRIQLPQTRKKTSHIKGN